MNDINKATADDPLGCAIKRLHDEVDDPRAKLWLSRLLSGDRAPQATTDLDAIRERQRLEGLRLRLEAERRRLEAEQADRDERVEAERLDQEAKRPAKRARAAAQFKRILRGGKK